MSVLAAGALAACSNPSDLQAGADDEVTDTGEIFNLTPSQRDALERAAAHGDGEAAYRLSEYWGMAGGESGLAGDAKNRVEQERWLRVATNAGHELAKFHLAIIVIAPRDCATARQMLTEIGNATTDPETRSSAHDWLRDDYLCERG